MIQKRVAYGILAAAAVLAFGLVTVARMAPRTAPGAPTPVVLVLPGAPHPRFAGYYVASSLGHYAEEGLDVTIRSDTTGLDEPIRDEENAVVFAVAGAEQLLIWRSKGIGIKGVAAMFRRSPFAWFTYETGEAERTLARARIGVRPGAPEHDAYRLLLAAARAGTADVHETQVGTDVAAFVDGQVEVWPGFAAESTFIAERSSRPLRMFSLRAYDVDSFGDVLYTRDAMIERSPDTVRRFVRATLKGWAYALEHPEDAARHVLAPSGYESVTTTAAFLVNSVDFMKPDVQPLGWAEFERWRLLHDKLRQFDMLERAVHVQTVFTQQFLPARERR